MRQSGILLHITSLDSPYGIGTIGKKAYEFIDFLRDSNQKYWQILPIGHTSFGDSPYQTFSAFAGNPYFIDLDILIEEKLLKEDEVSDIKFVNQEKVDYAFLYHTRYDLFQKAYDRFDKFHSKLEFNTFINDNKDWLDDYALFMSLKTSFKGMPWYMWDEGYKFRKQDYINNYIICHEKQIDYWKFIQFEFFKQWKKLKLYALNNKIEIIGDIPIYVAYDSADVWSNPHNFLVDDDLVLDVVSGVPPDYFSETGQLWGNPIYNYELMKKDGFSWWIRRVEKAFELFDYVRIDHFRGFESYYAIKSGETTAINGKWYKGPGYDLFKCIKEKLGDKKIIAEDLGFLTEEVYDLLKETGFPGMKILQFAFDPYNDNPYLPHNSIPNCVYYTGTHDNMTLYEFVQTLEGKQKDYVYNYCNVKFDEDNNIDKVCDTLIRIALSTNSNMVIIPLTDYLHVDKRGRMNTPSLSYGNWTYRINRRLEKENINYIKELTSIYKRNLQS